MHTSIIEEVDFDDDSCTYKKIGCSTKALRSVQDFEIFLIPSRDPIHRDFRSTKLTVTLNTQSRLTIF